MLEKRLESKVALITGGAQGIGKSIAKVFAEAGATVVITDILDELGEKTAKTIGAAYYHLDVSSEEDWKSVTQKVYDKHGQLNVLVNNAGITGMQEGFGPQDPENASLEDWRFIQAVNSDGTFLGCKYGIHFMKKGRGGSIINISSRSGIVGIPGAAAYAASKAAMRNHTKTVALYCCQQGYPIRCNSIHPAAILTPIWEPMLGSGEAREKNMEAITNGIPMKRMGMPEDVAYAALYLASEEASYVTGTELTVDGGILAGATASPKKAK